MKMIDSVGNFVNPYTSRFPSSGNTERIPLHDDDLRHQGAQFGTGIYLGPTSATSLTATRGSINKPIEPPNKIQTLLHHHYPPQSSSTGSVSPSSSLSASVSPNILPSPTSFPSNSPTQNTDLASSYAWNSYPRSQFPYGQYTAPDYYGNVSLSASAAWLQHQSWASNSYGFGNAFDDIAFQTQLQRRSVRCTCPNCTNEMSGLPPIVGPDERGRKQHICHIPGCDRLYGKASHLKTHLRWHTGERPFLCLTCGKRFSRSDELQRHGRTHTNYRPYNCPICSKKFSRSDHLSKHKKTHFKDKKTKKSAACEDKNNSKNTDTSAVSSVDEKSIPIAVDPLQNTSASALKSDQSPNTSPVDVSSGYRQYQNFYQNHALTTQNQQSAELNMHQHTNPSSYYPALSSGEANSTAPYSSFTHVQYDPLQAMNQSTSTYPTKSDVYANYPDLLSNGTAAANYPIALHQPWNAPNYQN